MRISIDSRVLAAHKLSLEEFIALFIDSYGLDIEKARHVLVEEKHLCGKNLRPGIEKLILSNELKEELSVILTESDKEVENYTEKFFNSLADKLREIYPEGRKAGTNYYWRDSTAIIAKKLKTLIVKYNFKVTEQEAIEATKKYVKSFNENYKYMHLLKYFILKSTTNSSGDSEVTSELMSYIQNKGTDTETEIDETDYNENIV